MFGEEQESPLKDYRHNELLFFEPPFTGINVFHPSTQPTPVPSSAPDEVEALFTRVRVDIRWKPPPLLQYQGKGAWINWTYELRLISLKNGQSNVFRVSGLKHTIRNLLPNSEYSLQVRAQSDAGEGPWSKLFIGKTLIDDNWSILLGVAGGQILRRNILEDQKKVVVNFFSNSTDIAWFENIAFWVTQEGQLTFYNQTSEEKRQLLKVEKAYSVAYDWLGKKVFWSDLSHVAIYRSDIIGIHVEFIRRSLARDLAIDALRGRLYWATQNSIETSYLNGEHHQELYVIPPFSGPNVISLTLDFDSEKVYWYVKALDSQSLYTTKLIPDNYVGHFPSMAEKVGDFKSISSTSGLQYFSQRLFWLSEKNSLMVGDLHCNFTATISSMTDIKSFVIVPSGLKYKSKPRVIPNPIRSSDIQTEGNSSKFNLTWSNSSEVTHGTVFYRVFIEIGNTNKSFTTSKNKIELSAYSPYIKIGVTIQPYTYWGYADPTTAYLRSPMSKPTAPLSPEVYVIEHKNATASYQTLAADFRWMSPIAINGIISHHFVYHWLGDDESSMTEVKVRGTTRNYILSPLIKNQTYHFKVVACTEAGCGPSSPNKSCVTNELNPVPKLLVGTTKGIGITETDSPYRDFTKLYPTIDEPLKAVSFLHQDDIRLYLINNRNAVVQAHENDLLEIFTLKGNGKDITVDWVSRTLYFVETFSSDKSSITQFNLDNGKYTVFLNRSANVQTIAVDPFNSAVLWLETSVDGEMQILSSDMTNKNVKTVLSSAISNTNKRDGFCNCTLLKNLASVMAVTYSRIDGRIEIFFAENQTGSIYSTDINGCKCIKIFSKSMSNSYGFPPSLIAVDHLRVSWYSQSDRKLYSVNKATGEGLTMQDFTDITDIVALGSNLQPLPDAQCLDPGAASSNVQKYEEGVNYIYLNLTSPIKPSSCLTISSPQTKYTLYYRTVKATKPGAAPEDCQVDLSQCSKLESYSTYMELKGLQPYTQYLIQVAVSNHFYPYLSEALGHPLVITTKFGAPSAALEVVSEPCTPEKIMVTWRPSQVLNGPADQIFYRVQYSTVLTQKETENIKINRTDESYIQTFVNDLTPGTVYTIKVFSCMGNRAQCTSSETVTVKTFLTPYDVFFSNATSYSIVMSWRSPPDNSILRHQIIYAEVTSEPLKWFESGILSVTDNNTQYEELITQLQPNTLYSFKIKASYNYRPFDDAHYIWPSDDSKFTYRTLVFLPNEVSTPDIRKLKSGLFEVKWEKPNDNGAPITNYELELSSADPDHFNWHLVYNGSDTRWLIETKELKPGKHYVFRVAAVNSQGRGAFSQNSSTFIAPHPIAEAGIGQGIIGIIAGTVAVFIAVIFIIIVVLIIQKRKTKTPHFIIRGPDTELATLRELPHTAFQQSNTLYAISIKCTDEEIAKLPHFSRNQLMLTMFLGSGAFGEVFEGLAKNILGDGSGETRCAVKTLRKSASDHEKEEFLKEALLMKNFQHDNILRLLGVCLDNDPQFIIMELMEGGDLLSFLRSCRATSTSPAKLLLPDLVKICVHVVRGCKYLEDMHFVHRDLAARNCLVSSKFPSDMIVKIGDFGLARDIYKNDYYRKEGEGLLPVRWMSPESLVDGFFTTQSDIWAFGVLMWEVLTLGQQPYPARTNIEVLHFVRDGGKLERPEKCTDEMFSLMRKCWSFNCDHRPSFAVLLENLELFQEKCLHMSPEEIIRYSPAVSDVLCMNNQLLPPLPSPAHLYMPPHPSSSSSQPCVENQYFLLEDSNQYSESIELLDSLYFNSQCSIDSQIENFISFERHDNITEILRELSTNENNNLISTAESNVLFASESFNLSYNKQFQVALMSTTKHNRCDRQIYKFSNWKEDENSYNSSKNKTLSVSANAFCNNALDNSLEEQKQNNSVSYLPSLSHIIINPVCSNINKHYDNTRSKGGPGAPMGNINLAFIDEAVNDDANHLMNEEDDLIEEEEEEEKAVMRGLFTPDKPIWGLYTKKVQTITGGGSVRLTQSGKQKRLKDLLSSPDGTEKLVVDLTKIGRKRTQSLEYSTKSSLDSSMDQFPAASNYDHHGYLEPRGTKNGPGYLELMNYAPELRHLRDTQGNPLTLHPSGAPITSVHVTRKGYHPSNINYTLLSPEESSQTGSFSVSGSDMCGEEDSNFQNSQYKDNLGHPYGRTSIDSPIYSRVCDERRLLHSDSSSSSRQFGNSSYYLHPSGQSVDAMLMRSNHQRKFSDQDLYYSTAPYRQRQSSSSSSTHDHRYASVECNNNYSSSNKGHANIAQGFINDNSASSYAYDGKSRHRHGSNNSSNLYAKPGLGFPNNGNVSFTAIEDNSKSNDLDDVFLDNTINSQCSFHPDAEVFSYPQQQNHILRSRGQVYPEHTAAFVGYDSNQVSLV